MKLRIYFNYHFFFLEAYHLHRNTETYILWKKNTSSAIIKLLTVLIYIFCAHVIYWWNDFECWWFSFEWIKKANQRTITTTKHTDLLWNSRCDHCCGHLLKKRTSESHLLCVFFGLASNTSWPCICVCCDVFLSCGFLCTSFFPLSEHFGPHIKCTTQSMLFGTFPKAACHRCCFLFFYSIPFRFFYFIVLNNVTDFGNNGSSVQLQLRTFTISLYEKINNNNNTKK